MNLIERLGGYEKAKRELELKEQNSVLQCCIAVTAEMIRDALLEYRRQHNIFEVGDKVIFTDVLNSCVVTFESIESNPMQIVWLTYPDGTAGYVFHLSKIRHATDEEIKAGGRLKANPIDSDIDKQVNLMDQFIADGGFDKAFVDVFGLPESVKKSLEEIS